MKNKLLDSALYIGFFITLFLMVVIVTKLITKNGYNTFDTAVNEPQRNTPLSSRAPIKIPTLYQNNEINNILNLSNSNTYIFRNVVTDESVAKALQVIITKTNKLSPNDTFYLVLDTPGGSVIAGTRFIDSLRALPVKVKTVTYFAASMGFQIAQSLDERLITPFGIMMSHRMFMSLEGQVPGELNNRLAFFTSIGTALDLNASVRMGMSLNDYQSLIHDEYYVAGINSIKDKAADSLVTVRCNADLMGIEKTQIATMFGPVYVIFSKCPAIPGPLAVKMDQLKLNDGEDLNYIREYVNSMINDRVNFVKKYIVTNTYKKIQIN